MIEKWTSIKHLTGIQIDLNREATSYQLITLHRQKSQIEKGIAATNINSTAQLYEQLDNKHPIALNITGKGILHKKIPASIQAPKAIIPQILPGAKAQDFYFQHVPTGDDQQYVSIIRRSTLDQVLQEFGAKNYHIVSVSLGGFSLATLHPMVEKKQAQLFDIGGYQLAFSGDDLMTCQKNTFLKKGDRAITIGNTQIMEGLALPFAEALRFYLSDESLVQVPAITTHKQEWHHRQFFQTAKWAVLGSLLGILLINFLLFSHFATQNNQLHSQVQQHQSALSQLETLQQKLQAQEAFLKQSGGIQQSKTSFYADRIASTLPDKVHLTKLSIFPLIADKSSKKKALRFEQNVLMVEGTCDKSTRLNEWLKVLKAQEWVEKVTTKHYGQEGENGVFELEVMVQ